MLNYQPSKIKKVKLMEIKKENNQISNKPQSFS
jgi:hypothetical protein